MRVAGSRSASPARITPAWQVFGGYTYLDAEIVSASALDGTQGKVPANTPKNSASLWTSYDFTREWQAGTGITYMSDRYAVEQQCGEGPGLLPLGRDGRLAAGRPTSSSSTCSTSPTGLNYDALIPSDRGRSVPGTNLQALLSVMYYVPLTP